MHTHEPDITQVQLSPLHAVRGPHGESGLSTQIASLNKRGDKLHGITQKETTRKWMRNVKRKKPTFGQTKLEEEMNKHSKTAAGRTTIDKDIYQHNSPPTLHNKAVLFGTLLWNGNGETGSDRCPPPQI